jgi:monoamine oxidase
VTNAIVCRSKQDRERAEKYELQYADFAVQELEIAEREAGQFESNLRMQDQRTEIQNVDNSVASKVLDPANPNHLNHPGNPNNIISAQMKARQRRLWINATKLAKARAKRETLEKNMQEMQIAHDQIRRFRANQQQMKAGHNFCAYSLCHVSNSISEPFGTTHFSL